MCGVPYCFFFFFSSRRRHTRCGRDWSSDVCSSDLINPVAADRGNPSIVVPLAHAAPWSGRLETFFTARAKHLQHLARRLAGARIVAPVGAMGPLAYEVDAPGVGGVLLVGDAAGFVDPFTGEGIYA